VVSNWRSRTSYKADFEKVKAEHLIDLYNEGTRSHFDKEQFAAAEKVFARIAKLEPGYKDASKLAECGLCGAPCIEWAKVDLEGWELPEGLCRQFSKVVEKNSAYKDASTLRQEALDERAVHGSCPAFYRHSDRYSTAWPQTCKPTP
jgi:hypothetical protein